MPKTLPVIDMSQPVCCAPMAASDRHLTANPDSENMDVPDGPPAAV